MSIKPVKAPSGAYRIFVIVLLITLLSEVYVYTGLQFLVHNLSNTIRGAISYTYWGFSLVVIGGFWLYFLIQGFKLENHLFRRILLPMLSINLLTKLWTAGALLLVDLVRLVQWGGQKLWLLFTHAPQADLAIERSMVMTGLALVVGLIPALVLFYGITQAHSYSIRRMQVTLPQLPQAFDGLKIVQLSDIHSGSFSNKMAVQRGINKILQEKPDLIFFTGDLVNQKAVEMKPYMSVFAQLKAPLGVFSVLGNHDYGDYVTWPSSDAKQQNLADMYQVHEKLGWRLLRNEHHIVNKDNARLAILGVENWSAVSKELEKYGKLDQAYQGVEDLPVKLLLSHDPSHWDAQVRKQYPDIDITFSGHTHGGQFGLEIGDWQWSPVKYMYKQWAGLYQMGQQYLYVNRGFGYIGYPGRIGMAPEIAVIELRKG